MAELWWAAVALIVAVAGIVASVILGLPGWREWWRAYLAQRKEARELPAIIFHDHFEAIKMQRVMDDIEAEYRRIHYRHNIHCPKCGKFSRLVEGLPGAVDCHTHGLVASTPTMAIEIVRITDSPTLELDLPLAEELQLR